MWPICAAQDAFKECERALDHSINCLNTEDNVVVALPPCFSSLRPTPLPTLSGVSTAHPLTPAPTTPAPITPYLPSMPAFTQASACSAACCMRGDGETPCATVHAYAPPAWCQHVQDTQQLRPDTDSVAAATPFRAADLPGHFQPTPCSMIKFRKPQFDASLFNKTMFTKFGIHLWRGVVREAALTVCIQLPASEMCSYCHVLP